VIPETHFICSDLNVLSVGLVGLLVAAIAAMPLWYTIARRFGDYKAWLAFNFLNAITNILLLFPGYYWEDRVTLVIVTCIFAALNGLPMGAKFLTDNILGMVIDYDELRRGVRTEAAFTMFSGFIPKVVSVPAAAFPLSILAAIGFKAPAPPNGEPNLYQPEKVTWGIRIMFAVVPTFLALLSCYLKATRFPFKDLGVADAEIKAGLLLRRQGRAYLDPLSRKFVLPAPPPRQEWLRSITLLDHFTGPNVIIATLEESPADRGSWLRRRATKQLIAAAVCTGVALTGTAVTISLGMLQNRAWGWVPSILVILTGLGVLAVLVAWLRRRAAQALCELNLSDELLKNVLAERSLVPESEIPRPDVSNAFELVSAVASLEANAWEIIHDPRRATMPAGNPAGVALTSAQARGVSAPPRTL